MDDIKALKKEFREQNPEVSKEIRQNSSFQTAQEIKKARRRKGMTQQEVADKMSTKQPAIARAESGKHDQSVKFLERMAKEAFDSYLLPPRFAFMYSADAVNYGSESGGGFKKYANDGKLTKINIRREAFIKNYNQTKQFKAI